MNALQVQLRGYAIEYTILDNQFLNQGPVGVLVIGLLHSIGDPNSENYPKSLTHRAFFLFTPPTILVPYSIACVRDSDGHKGGLGVSFEAL